MWSSVVWRGFDPLRVGSWIPWDDDEPQFTNAYYRFNIRLLLGMLGGRV